MELPPFGKFATVVVIFGSSCSQMLFKIDAFRNIYKKTPMLKSLFKFHKKTPMLKSIFNRVADD